MRDKFEIETNSEQVLVWMRNWKGGSGVAAEFNIGATSEEIAQEVYELLAAAGMEVKFVEA